MPDRFPQHLLAGYPIARNSLRGPVGLQKNPHSHYLPQGPSRLEFLLIRLERRHHNQEVGVSSGPTE